MINIRELAGREEINKCLQHMPAEIDELVQLAIEIQQIPAPTFAERGRAEHVRQLFEGLSLKNVEIDFLHNVFGCLPGERPSPPLVISAHLDTVFPADTNLSIRHEVGQDANSARIYGPGIADNALGAAGLIILAQTMKKCGYRPSADVWFVANSCEEGLGDLKGMRRVVDRFGDALAYLVIEGGSYGNIFNQAIGVRRFKIEVETPGGHSWGDFGAASAVHILGRIIAGIDKMPLPAGPKSSYNIGVIEGGTSVNTIAASAYCLVDLRSLEDTSLDKLESSMRQIVRQKELESSIQIKVNKIGDRPSGYLDKESAPVCWAAEALEHVGCSEISFLGGSTDANIPLSQGYPAVCIGLANAGNTHRIDEYMEPENLLKGMSQLFLVAAAALAQ